MSYYMRRRRSSTDELNLDSLVDVVTNTNGMLILLAIFMVLLAVGKTYSSGFPIARTPNKNAVFFECTGNKIVMISDLAGYSDNYYQTPSCNSTMVTLKPKHKGYYKSDLEDPASGFWRLVSSIDPRTQYAAFLVRSDSFEINRAVRSALRDRGIESGWEPFHQHRAITFGSSGRGIGVQ